MTPFLHLNFKLDLTPIYNELPNIKWNLHERHNLLNCDLPYMYKQEIRLLFNLPQDHFMVIHNIEPYTETSINRPRTTYFHIDSHRYSAIMIPLSLDNPNHYTEFQVDNNVMRTHYTQGVPVLYNTKVLHKATSIDSSANRNLIAIGIIKTTYDDLVEMYLNGSLINYDKFEQSILKPKLLS